MRNFLLFALVCLANLAQATNYYFSSQSGDDSRTSQQAQNPLTPWRTTDKFNAINLSLKPGDSVFFKRGDVFFGDILIRSSGTSGNPIYYGAYGEGSNPVISGFRTLSNWTHLSGGIYYASLDVPSLNIVTVNGQAQGMGRFPNTGFLKYENHNGNQSITSASLSSGTNWTGGEVVIRKYRFILDRHTITSQSGTTLNYSTSTAYGNNTAFSPVKNNGFFIQNHLGTLDQFGEWYYDAASKRLYMHFGNSAPSNFAVRASARDYNAFVTTANFLTFENLNFEGGNTKGFFMTTTSNTLVKDCHFFNQGGVSFDALDVSWITVRGGSVNTSFSNGVFFENNAHNCTVDGVTVNNTNMIPGTGRSGTGISVGITINGDGSRIINNKVFRSGYNGISFLGNNVLVERNLIDTYCTIKDDGGGIYTYIGESNTLSHNRKVRNNIILNAIGAFAGAESNHWEAFGKAAGIYLDEHVNNVEVTGNTVANGDWGGIFLHNAHRNVISNNIFYNHRYQVLVSQYTAMTRLNTMTNNQFISKYGYQETFYYRTFVSDNPSTMGTFDNNYYARPIDDNKTIHCDFYQSGGAGTQYYTLDQWKSFFSLDRNSQKSPITYRANIDDSVRFEYNATNIAQTVSLDANYVDVRNNEYSGSVVLQPFTGVVLLKTRTATTTTKQNQTITFPSIAAKVFGDAPFTVNATASSGLPVTFRIVSGPATVSGNQVTISGAGVVTVEAIQGGNATFNAATPVSQSFTVSKASQFITFDPLSNKVSGDAPFEVNAVSSANLPVSYRVTAGPATVSGNMVTITGTGTVWIEASQNGNSNYNAASSVSQSFNVSSAGTGTNTNTTKQDQTISMETLPYRTFGTEPFEITATASSGLPVSFRVLSGPATISGNIVTVNNVGNVTIEAMQAGNSSFNAATPVQRSFTVGKASQSINFPHLSDRVLGDDPFALTATASSGLPVSYRVVSGPATLSGNIVTLTGAGTVTIEASQPGNHQYNAAWSPTRSFTVSSSGVIRQNQTITFPAIHDRTFGDDPFALTATASSGLPVSYRVVSGPATVSGNMVTITGTGTVWIEASQNGNSDYNAASSVSQSFNVSRASTTKQNQTITFGTLAYQTFTSPDFTLTATASSGLPVSYRVVTGPVSISGNIVKIHGVGNVTIEAMQAGNSSFNAATPVQRSFTVGKAGQSINFPHPPNRVLGDDPFALTATASSGLPVSYRVVSGPATVSGNIVRLTGAGTVTIEASQPGNANFDAAFSPQRSFTVSATGSTSSVSSSQESRTEMPLEMKSTISVYPNPVYTQGVISIVAGQAMNAVVDIVDVSGRVVQSFGTRRFEQGQTTNIELDASRFVSGIYIIRLASQEGVLSHRFQVIR